MSQGEHGDRICAIGDRNSHATSSKGAQLRWSTLEAERLLGLTDLGALSSYDRLLRTARVLGLLLPCGRSFGLREVHSAACLLEDTFHWRVLCKRKIEIDQNRGQTIRPAERPVSPTIDAQRMRKIKYKRNNGRLTALARPSWPPLPCQEPALSPLALASQATEGSCKPISSLHRYLFCDCR